MSVIIRAIETEVPPNILIQDITRDVFAAQPGLTRLGQRLVGSAFDASGIHTRHSVVDDFNTEGPAGTGAFYDRDTGLLGSPGTRERNELYIERARELTLAAARRALGAVSGLTAADISHVITVSCTGFYAPGPDYQIVRELGLAPGTLRYNIGFMGCYAAFPALRAAQSFCEADPGAVVLIVSTELCSIHVRSSSDPDQIVAASVFADGAAAAIVSARTDLGTAQSPGLRLDRLRSELVPVGETEMAWTIGDEGFEMILSASVPKIIDTYIAGALGPVLEAEPELAADPAGNIGRWAVHPGGRSILDRVQNRLGLSEEQMIPSRTVLRDYGNMSSATILFVLREILHDSDVAAGERVCAMAFGPGLTVETGLLTRTLGDGRADALRA
ncbi:type III polyketide synthase [Mycetocola spongiae]|uniref:type III polyketide synthase n=1 Tax=Mycetocola spongiae TaxID=2859226 RepID=UPI001CF2EA87|nr:type III polyketide synthase [Mycetocola spongiae]UCR89375.1 type III polyketide synthase [Mycetocola spongiae]